ncbi:retrovirus-related pol polyprotein from transposon TNT 1-94 [Tanacetum coccineum]
MIFRLPRPRNMVFGHVLDECPKKFISEVSKNLTKPRQAARGPPTGLKPKYSDSDVEVAYNETAQFMANGGTNDASLYEDEVYDIFDTYDIEDYPKEEENLRSHQGYMNDLNEELLKRDILDISKRFLKKNSSKLSSSKPFSEIECFKCDNTGHMARDCYAKTSASSYITPQ